MGGGPEEEEEEEEGGEEKGDRDRDVQCMDTYLDSSQNPEKL